MSSQMARLRWRCRRGMRELDLMLEAYLRRFWETAPLSERKAFEVLLEMEDPELYRLLAGHSEAPDPKSADVVAKIRNAVLP